MHGYDIDRLVAEERFGELERLARLEARRARRRTRLARAGRAVQVALARPFRPVRPAVGGPLTLRVAGEDDAAALARLAGFEERPAPGGPTLIALVGGEILAALPLDGSPPLTDPFRSTSGLVDLLELRSRQLEHELGLAA